MCKQKNKRDHLIVQETFFCHPQVHPKTSSGLDLMIKVTTFVTTWRKNFMVGMLAFFPRAVIVIRASIRQPDCQQQPLMLPRHAARSETRDSRHKEEGHCLSWLPAVPQRQVLFVDVNSRGVGLTLSRSCNYHHPG